MESSFAKKTFPGRQRDGTLLATGKSARRAVFVAGKLLGLSFKPLTTGLLTQGHIPVYHPDVSVYQVTDRAGETVGLWYFDPWARPGKNSGAWMNAYRDQERFDGKEITIVSNNANFIKGATGKPALISWEDALTMFHEFGHALHGLSSNVSYPSLSGTNVATDYVEFPSQLLEHWLYTPEVLGRYALNYKTGRPMPGAMIAAIRKSEMFMQGFQTVEYLSSALIDMKLHLAGETRIDPKGFERRRWWPSACPRKSQCGTGQHTLAMSSPTTAMQRVITVICGRTRSPRMPTRLLVTHRGPMIQRLQSVSTKRF